ncbi:MAG: MFS transporter [Candidatus Binatia bacterium]
METQTAIRWRILWLLIFVSLVRSVDALNFSVAAKQIMPEYGFTTVQMGLLYTAFTAGYGLFHLPGGWLADLFGPRRILAIAILWWSAFTGLTAVAGELSGLSTFLSPFWAFLLIRFCVGIGEGAAYPTTSKTVSNWMAPDERGFASGLVWSGAGLGYAIAPPLVAWMMVGYGWRPVFFVLAVLGIVIAAVWYGVVRDRPDVHPQVNTQELKKIYGNRESSTQGDQAVRHPPWRILLTDRNVVLLSVASFFLGYVAYIYQSWFYLYLVNVRGFAVVSGGLFAAGPFLAVTLLCPIGGFVSDALTARYGSKTGRRGVALTCFFSSAVCMYLGAHAADPYLAVFLLSLGDGLVYASLGASWGAIIDISGVHTGAVYGIVGMFANFGGMLAPTLTPMLAERYSWEIALHVAALLAAVAGLVWLAIDASKKLVLVGEPTPTPAGETLVARNS